jgi:hypothetical protein
MPRVIISSRNPLQIVVMALARRSTHVSLARVRR